MPLSKLPTLFLVTRFSLPLYKKKHNLQVGMDIKNCAKCQKQVYPVERLDLLEKTWHKGCFVCEVCGMKLTMKTYVALDKIPYCKAHYPKQQASAVVDTPELLRLQQNTKNQSKVAYTSEYQKNVHEFKPIADQPEIQRHMKNMKVISNAQYHGHVKTTGAGVQSEAMKNIAREAGNIESEDGFTYEAVNEYETDEEMEVSIKPGDLIMNAIVAAEGWLQGTNDRTGKSGFIPETYCRRL